MLIGLITEDEVEIVATRVQDWRLVLLYMYSALNAQSMPIKMMRDLRR